jgi:tRNA(fMet)-specific endonuclease VapC
VKENEAYLLDTDTVSNYLDKQRGTERLRERIAQANPETIYVSIITFEEILKGVLNLLNQARKHPRNASKVIEYYGLLQSLAQDLGHFQILPYDTIAEAKYQNIPAAVRQHHSQDSHIAAIALAHDLIVITSNTRHFSKIPDLPIEDWSIE